MRYHFWGAFFKKGHFFGFFGRFNLIFFDSKSLIMDAHGQARGTLLCF